MPPLTDVQESFLKRYVISPGPKLDVDLDELKLRDRKEKLKKDVVNRIREGGNRWISRETELKGMDIRDRLINYAWMDRDADSFERLSEDARAFLTSGEKGDFSEIIKSMRAIAEAGRSSMKKEVEKKIRTAVQTTWPRMVDDASQPGLSFKDKLHQIENIEDSIAELHRSARLAGIEATAINSIDTYKDNRVTPLRTACIASLPDFNGVQAPAPSVGNDLPTLTLADNDCLKIYSLYGRDWFELKKNYKSGDFLAKVEKEFGGRPGADGTEVMWQLWAYRKKVVDNLVKEAATKFGVRGEGKGWTAVGSTNLESDYDLTIMEHGEGGEDWKVVAWFNAEFQKRFGTQPGIMFDTNLYASAKPRVRLSDDPQTESEKAMAAMVRAGQDVGALMKQRRFMSWEEYDAMMNEVLDEMEKDGIDAQIVLATRNQFEEADAKFQMAQLEIIRKAKTIAGEKKEEIGRSPSSSEEDIARREKLEEILKIITEMEKKHEDVTGVEAANAILKAAKELEKHEDILLAVNNEIYVEAVKKSREFETQARDRIERMEYLREQVESIRKQKILFPEWQPAEEMAAAIKKDEEELEKLEAEFEGKTARSKDLFADAVFFANEAYHSEGPFKHVVLATQAVAGDVKNDYIKKHSADAWAKLGDQGQKALIDAERTKRRDGLSLHDCLQSFNEQLGDFIKDLHHHEDDALPGTGFFRSSKYLDRLVDAADLLNQKVDGNLGVQLPGNHEPQALRRTLGEGLLALRKGKIQIRSNGDDANEEERQEQEEAFAIAEIHRLFEEKTLKGLGKRFKDYGSKVNAKLRALIAEEMRARNPGAYFAGAK